LILKLLRSDYSFWELFVPATQIALNDRIISAHHLRPFSVMFGRKLNGFSDFRGTDIKDVPLEELLERNLQMVETIWPWVSEEIKVKGKERAAKANKAAKAQKRLKPFAIGSKVMKKVDERKSKFGQRWEGPFEVEGYNRESNATS
jgi:hypothetical protein